MHKQQVGFRQMMRIHVSQTHQESTLKIEGEMEGSAIEELANSWRNALSSGAKNVVVDLTGVIHIDRIARTLLKSMHNSGVRFTGARLAIQDILDELSLPGLTEPRAKASGKDMLT